MIASLLLGVLLMNVLALGLVVARGPVFGTRVYRPMLLNLALSAAPLLVLLLSYALIFLLAVGVPRAVVLPLVGLLLLVWLLLLPNAGYLVTELNLSHRRDGDGVPMWFDVVLVISLAMAGVLNTVLNVLLVQLEWTIARHGDVAAPLLAGDTLALVAVVLLLVSFGMYLGRHLRLNSWDVVRPWRVVAKTVAHLREPRAAGQATAFTLLYALFFAVMYVAVAGPVIQALVLLEQ
ncbi:DUF1361 domain-containing protein [Cellulomonas fimi]|uniref:DUF1361 domain-containing protein n=1 Tax=Cellulomonas fimi TaxID=1708 RepID=UPI002359F165|nr:DUF1361 domain-containing protein [Cellulomonas fimi]